MSAPREHAFWFELFTEIGIIDQLAGNAMERALPEGLSMAGFQVLLHLQRLPGDWGPARLAKAFQVTKGAMTNTVQRLEAQGFVALEPDPADARAKFVRLTPAGEQARLVAVDALTPKLAAVAGALDLDEAQATLPFLRKLRAYLDANR
jgi:DNA-binding MarR family transcriptional regulator